MKRMITSIFMLMLAATTLSAQVRSHKSGIIEAPNAVAYSLPLTTIKINLTVQKESIRKGPYARFAQKFLGVIAPLADKDLYTVVGGTLCAYQEADPNAVFVLENQDKSTAKLYDATAEGLVAAAADGVTALPARFNLSASCPATCNTDAFSAVSYIGSDTNFVKVSVDRRDVIEKSAESMAADAANTIYLLRKRRMELVTGEAGENVFGQGLKAALDELNRLEQEYLCLFLGKHFKEVTNHTFEVTPEQGKTNVIFCRFSDTAGILSDSDLSGRPVIMEFNTENKTAQTALTRKIKDPRGTVMYRIADIVNCKVVEGKQQICSDRIPIYQFGKTVDLPVSSLK